MMFTRMGLFLVSGLLVASCAAAPSAPLAGSSGGQSNSGSQASANDRFALLGQEVDCIPCEFNTFTQGGWGNPDNSQPGQTRIALFATGFVATIGSAPNTRVFDDENDVQNYLPSGGEAGAIPNEGVFGGQVLALTLNIAVNPGLEQVIIVGYDPDGDNTDNTVAQFLADANTALGGNGLPNGYTFSQLSDIAASINEFFHDEEEPFLPIPTDGTTFECPDGGVQVPNS